MTDVQTEMIKFGSDGSSTPGFLARPGGGTSVPGVIVIQEWWGLNDNIKDIATRFAREGFAAVAPDLYHGVVTKEPDEAGKLMMRTDMSRASRELVGAAEYLDAQPYTAGHGIGAVGFCMGGGLALTLACHSPLIKAVAPFYGVNPDPIDRVRLLQGPVLAIYAEHDEWAGPPVRQALEAALRANGKKYQIEVYPGTEHAFFNDTRPEVFKPEAAADAWNKVIALFRATL